MPPGLVGGAGGRTPGSLLQILSVDGRGREGGSKGGMEGGREGEKEGGSGGLFFPIT